MKHKISLFAFGHATSLFLLMSFSVCVGFGLLFPQQAMYEVWLKLLPGFEWRSWKSFFLGDFFWRFFWVRSRGPT